MDACESLSQYLTALTFEELPESTLCYTKMLIIDYYASAMAGYQLNKEFNEKIERIMAAMGGTEESTVIVSGARLPAPHAAFLNAAFAHGADMDDGHRRAGGHPGGPIISAVMALAEAVGSDSRDVLLAIVCGYEAMIRTAACVQPEHVNRGFHSTGTAGAAGAAVAAAKLLGLDADGMSRAFSLGLLQASGLMMVTESGQTVKPLNPAKAAYTGVLSARMAQSGIEAPKSPFESPKGFLNAFGENGGHIDAILEGLGSCFAIDGCYIKPYPCCRATHAGAEAMLILRDSIPNPADVERIELYVYPRAIFIAGDPCNHVPATAENAKFSLAFSVASVLHTGGITIEQLLRFGEMDPEIFETCKKIVLVPDPSTEDVAHGRRGCRLKVYLKNQTVLEHEVILPKGDPEVPMTIRDISNKLASCASLLMPQARQDALIQSVLNMGTEAEMPNLPQLTVN